LRRVKRKLAYSSEPIELVFQEHMRSGGGDAKVDRAFPT
jgi:hypothetical protein